MVSYAIYLKFLGAELYGVWITISVVASSVVFVGFAFIRVFSSINP